MTDLDETIRRVRELSEAARDLKTWAVHVRDDDTAQVYATARGLCRQVVPVAETTPELAPLIAYYRTAAPLLADECEALADECERLRRENGELATLNAINTHGCDRALDQAELAAGVVAGLTTECERLRERVRVLEEALRPFVENADDEVVFDMLVGAGLDVSVTEARAALEGKP